MITKDQRRELDGLVKRRDDAIDTYTNAIHSPLSDRMQLYNLVVKAQLAYNRFLDSITEA